VTSARHARPVAASSTPVRVAWRRRAEASRDGRKWRPRVLEERCSSWWAPGPSWSPFERRRYRALGARQAPGATSSGCDATSWVPAVSRPASAVPAVSGQARGWPRRIGTVSAADRPPNELSYRCVCGGAPCDY